MEDNGRINNMLIFYAAVFNVDTLDQVFNARYQSKMVQFVLSIVFHHVSAHLILYWPIKMSDAIKQNGFIAKKS